MRLSSVPSVRSIARASIFVVEYVTLTLLMLNAQGCARCRRIRAVAGIPRIMPAMTTKRSISCTGGHTNGRA
ncbi:hypothetical protein C8Q80DRAFT_1125765 [Daedaleopsis nitida]|nr:hypothetical protein C8Q80DRAFT_1125765 [Daedaleopsis nitida]